MLYYDTEESSFLIYTCMSDEQSTFTPKTPWNKTTGGIIFITIISLIITVFAVFLFFIGYYSWKIKFGDASAIEQSLNASFSSLYPNQPSSGPLQKNALPVATYLQPTNPVRGSSDAPLTIVAFIDFECPFSQQSHPIFESIVNRYDPAIKVVFKHFPIAAIHPNALAAAQSAECAGEQQLFWQLYQTAFNGKSVTPEALNTYLTQIGIDQTAYTACMNNKQFNSRIQQDIQDGIALGVRGTPTYFVGNTKIEGVIDPATWDVVLIEELKRLAEEKK